MNLIDRWRRPTCHKVMKVLQQFLDGELGAAHADFVAAHLAECDRCNIEAEIYDEVKMSLAALQSPPDLAALSRIEAKAEQLLAHPDSADTRDGPP